MTETLRPKSSKTTSNTISFRVTGELMKSIDDECRRFEVSRGELVRAIVKSHFETRPEALLEQMSVLTKKMGLLHRNQARMLVAILNTVARLPYAEAKKITTDSLLS